MLPRTKKPPRATRKPAPDNYGDWLAEIAGINKFLSKEPANLTREASEWLARTKRYYKERLEFLAANPPKGLSTKAARVIAAEVLSSVHVYDFRVR